MTDPERCPDCGGSRVPFLHLRKDCPSAERPRYVPRRLTAADQLKITETVVVQLLEHARQFGLYAPARSAWPDDFDLVELDTPGERTIWTQLRIAQRRLRKLSPRHPLLEQLSALLLRPRGQIRHDGRFRAPETIPPLVIDVPRPIRRVIDALKTITPDHAPLARPQPTDTPDVARDRRLLQFWLDERGG